jgi:hypothetical protein
MHTQESLQAALVLQMGCPTQAALIVVPVAETAQVLYSCSRLSPNDRGLREMEQHRVWC